MTPCGCLEYSTIDIIDGVDLGLNAFLYEVSTLTALKYLDFVKKTWRNIVVFILKSS